LVFIMDTHLKEVGLGLLGRVLDYGVARLTAPKKSHTEQRLEQIDRALHTLESVPDVGHHWTAPPATAPESQKEALPVPATTDIPQTEDTAPAIATELSPSVVVATPAQEPAGDEYCVGCGPNNHLAKAQSHIEEALRLSRGKGELVPDVVAPRIRDAVAELGGYEDGDIKHMREKAAGALKDILDDLATQTRALRNFLRYDQSGLELGRGSIEDLEAAAAWIRKLRQLGYYSVMVEVGQRVKAEELESEGGH
jgi:hypothetical protein